MEFTSEEEQTGIAKIQEMISPISSGRLEIAVPDQHKGKYELPRPAHEFIPQWYKELDDRPNDDKPFRKSMRACMPAMEALTFGWIIPTPTDVAIVEEEDGYRVEWADETFNVMGRHPKEQVGGDSFPHDGEIIKFNLPYMMRTPEGISTLYMPPLNRVETRFRPFSGVVDTDEYVNEVNIPALMLDEDWSGIIEAGTPLVQVIPFERDGIVSESETREMTEEEENIKSKIGENVSAVDAFYRQEVWNSIDSSKESGCPLGFGDD